MNRSKAAVVMGQIVGTVQIVLGVFLIVFALIGGLGDGVVDGMDILVMLIFIVPGILLSVAGSKSKKRIKLFKKYVTILANDESGSISNLVRETNTSENIVQANLQKMIDKKYFSNAYIDLNMNCVVFPNRVSTIASTFNSTSSQGFGVEATSEISTVTCKGCGASNKVAKGQVRECEYCGSAIKG